MNETTTKKKLSLTTYIFMALVLGVAAGLLLSHADIATEYIQPFGTIFLNLSKMVAARIRQKILKDKVTVYPFDGGVVTHLKRPCIKSAKRVLV